ncbi:MAG TPA: trypsin-like peptidase domain-containing protein [Pyrinomonadaceae bacterium]|nr:trypsin-like peptidase domain-containing protein [Pyrinomonadaceae bacterium]
MTLADVISVARKSVVRVETLAGQGSGVVISTGAIITNAHVVGSEPIVSVIDEEGNKLSGTVIWRDRRLDLSVIIVTDRRWPPIAVGDLSGIREGDEVIALGHPLGFTFTVTRGIVSAKAREYNGHVYIQTDAAINPGNSGGPLLDCRGTVIGINTFIIRGGYALNFAIPIDRALNAAGGVLSGEQENVSVCCHACMSPIRTDTVYCLMCGARFRTQQPSEASVTPPEGSAVTPAGEVKCPACATSQKATAAYCEMCGKSLRRS